MTDRTVPPSPGDQLAYWNGPAGERWADLQAPLDEAFEPLTAALMAAAAASPGERVLDIGCGTGATLLALGERVGPSGFLLGVDVSRPMLAVAEARIARSGLAHASVRLADASRPLDVGGFDLACSRFGVMFFDEPAAAFATIRGSLEPDGRLVFACWQALSANPWFTVPTDAIRALLPGSAPPADPLAPGPLALADPDRVRRILAEAGYIEVAVEPAVAPLRLGDVPAALDLLTQVGPASRALAEGAPEQRPVLREALRSALAAHAGPDGQVRLDGAIWLVTARVSGG